jgi:zinc transport system permease protein
VLASLSGVLGSYYVDTAPGALIVVLALAGFALASLAGTLVRRTRRPPVPPAQAALVPQEGVR